LAFSRYELSVGAAGICVSAPRQYLTGIDFPLRGTQSGMDFIVNVALSGEQK
jgi:hypothetical protein